MIVCLCRGLSDTELKATIRRGATSVSELASACGAGGDCGSCVNNQRELVDEVCPHSSDAHAEPSPSAAPNV